MVAIKKETITITEDDFAKASANVIKKILGGSDDILDSLEKEMLKALCLNLSGELFLELFVEVTGDKDKEE